MATCHITASESFTFPDVYGMASMQSTSVMGDICCEQPEVTVAFVAPYRIQHANNRWLSMMGLSSAQASGRSLGLVQGPATDVMTLNSLIKGAALGHVQSAITALYTRDGHSILMRVTALLSEGTPEKNKGMCRLVMTPTDDASLKPGLLPQEEDMMPQVVLSAQAPHIVQSVSPSFSALYGLFESQILGRTLHFIHGPRTDIQRWGAMIKGALLGQVQCHTLFTCAADCSEFLVDVTMTPVSRPEGKVTHIIVQLSEPLPITAPAVRDVKAELVQQEQAPYSLALENYLAHQQDFSSCHQTNLAHIDYQSSHHSSVPSSETYSLHQTMGSLPLHMEAPWKDAHVSTHGLGLAPMLEHAPATFSSGMDYNWLSSLSIQDNSQWQSQHQFKVLEPVPAICGQGYTSIDSSASSPQDWLQDNTCSAIFPRRKAGQSKSEPLGPVLITLEVLEAMADVPLTDAAKKLGVSSTAIKKACRKLGVQRWPYRKHAEGSNQAEVLSHYNDAYVRRLFRKYSPKVPKKEVAKSTSPKGSAAKTSSANTPDHEATTTRVEDVGTGKERFQAVSSSDSCTSAVSYSSASSSNQPEASHTAAEWGRWGLGETEIDTSSWQSSLCGHHLQGGDGNFHERPAPWM